METPQHAAFEHRLVRQARQRVMMRQMLKLCALLLNKRFEVHRPAAFCRQEVMMIQSSSDRGQDLIVVERFPDKIVYTGTHCFDRRVYAVSATDEHHDRFGRYI